MGSHDPADLLGIVARRGSVLRTIGTGGVPKRDLVDALDVSRSTVDRAVRELEGVGLIEREDGGYRRTLAGELILGEYDDFRRRVEGVVSGMAALSGLPPTADVDATLLDGATVVEPEPHSPHLPVSRLEELVRGADSVRAVLPAVFPQLIETLHAEVVDAGMTVELVVTDPVAEHLVSSHAAELEGALATDRLALRKTGATPDCGLLLVEAGARVVAAMVVRGEAGARALVYNENPDAVTWLRDRLADYWADATALTVNGRR